MDTGGSNPFNSAHSDVLTASVPADTVGRLVLTTELKNRAKGAVQAQMWPDAVALYKKAVEVVSKDDNKEELAILHANMSLCHGKMNQWEAAREAADLATSENENYVKGWWRLGQAQAALQTKTAAVKAMERAYSIEPNNKLLKKELDKFRAMPDQPKVTRKLPAKTTTSTSKPVSSSSPATSAKDKTVVDKGDKSTFTSSDVVRGYKIVNGKKTSYFHNELSDDARELIGDIRPKKLEESASAPQPTAAAASKSTSAWNQAGTCEEKDVTAWALESMQKKLQEAIYASGDTTASTVSAKVTGSASVATVRSKKRYIYELAIVVNWKVSQNGEDVASGSLKFPDVDGTCVVGEPYEISEFKIDGTSTMPLSELQQLVHKDGLPNVLHQKIDEWVELLKETY